MSSGVEEELARWRDEAARRALASPTPVLRVLVWGPSLALSDTKERRGLQRKRAEIVDELRRRGHAAATSEDLVRGLADPVLRAGVRDQPIDHVEAHQLESADFVIVLFGPPGTVAEVAGLLSRRRSAARRSAVFYRPDEVAGSYSDEGPLAPLKALGVTWAYDRDDLDSCRVRALAIEFVADMEEMMRGTTP